MRAVAKALAQAARSLVHPSFLLILLVRCWLPWRSGSALAWPIGIPGPPPSRRPWPAISTLPWAARLGPGQAGLLLAAAVVLAILAPAVILTAILIATVFAMPVLVRHVARKDYPNLEWRHGGTVAGSIGNALARHFGVRVVMDRDVAALAARAACSAAAAFAVGLAEPAAVSLRRLVGPCRRGGNEADFRSCPRPVISAWPGYRLIYFIPPFNLVAPVFAALAFIHLCLAELERLREEKAGLRT